MKASFVARALGIKIPSALSNSDEFTEISTDTRSIKPGSLFIALRGDTHDGHNHLDQAIRAGAKALLVERDTSHLNFPAFQVPNTQEAIRNLAAHWRLEFKIPVIAVAGSVGKTTTKELLASILASNGASVLKTEASQNGFLGIPFTLLKLRSQHTLAVIEIGIDEIGAMQKHLEVVQPTATLLTAIGPEHLEKLINIETVAREEGLALEWICNRTLDFSPHPLFGVVNLDDPFIKPWKDKISADRRYTFQLNTPSTNITDHAQALFGKWEPNQTHLITNGMGWINESFTLPLPGTHNVHNLLAALTVARALGRSAEECRKGISDFLNSQSSKTPGRNEVRDLPNGIRVLCDYYNANPTSVGAAFEVLSSIHRPPGKKWVCLGDMLELGDQTIALHKGLAKNLLDSQSDGVFLLGPLMNHLFTQIKTESPHFVIHHFKTHSELSAALASNLSPGDTVLLKGSRGMKMELILPEILKYSKTNS